VTGLYLTICKAAGGKETHNPRKSEAADPRFRLHVNFERLINKMVALRIKGIYKNYSQTL